MVGYSISEATTVSHHIEARLLRKRSRGLGRLFFEALTLKESDDHTPYFCALVLTSGNSYSSEDITSWRSQLHAGDVVRVQGIWSAIPEEEEADIDNSECEVDITQSKHARFRNNGNARPIFCVEGIEVTSTHREVHGTNAFVWSPGTQRYPMLPIRFALQCDASQACRLVGYIHETFSQLACSLSSPQPGSQDRVIVARAALAEDVIGVLTLLTKNAHMNAALRRVFVVNPVLSLSLQQAVSRLASLILAEGHTCAARVQVYPRYLEEHVARSLHEKSVRLECKKFSHVASLVYADAVYSVGLIPRSILCPDNAHGLDILRIDGQKSPKQQLNRAYSKLHEVLLRSGWLAELETTRPRRAVDIGAAPGGWSACLSSAWGCEEILAVDPGDLSPELTARDLDSEESSHAVPDALRGQSVGKIRHMQMRWEEASLALRQRGDTLDVLACDANIPCDQVVDIFEDAAVDLLNTNAYVVLTFKNCSKTKAAFNEIKGRQIRRLQETCMDVREIQLLANRKLETTVLARFRKKTDNLGASM